MVTTSAILKISVITLFSDFQNKFKDTNTHT